MPWIRFEDNFPEHPKVLGISDGAFRLHVRAIAYCSRHLTDGVVSPAAVRSLSGGRAARLTSELVSARMWTVTDHGWLIHDYLEYQPSRAETEERRKADRDRKKAEGIRSGSSRKLRGI